MDNTTPPSYHAASVSMNPELSTINRVADNRTRNRSNARNNLVDDDHGALLASDNRTPNRSSARCNLFVDDNGALVAFFLCCASCH